jgi:succinyl-CoA:acetate CoA-transferase
MHDIYYRTSLPPNRKPIELLRPGDRVGEKYLRCPPEKIIAMVPTRSPDRKYRAHGARLRLAAHRRSRAGLPGTPGEGGPAPRRAVAAAIRQGQHRQRRAHRLDAGQFRPLTAHTGVIQDGMVQLLRSGTVSIAFALSDDGLAELRGNIARLPRADYPSPAGDQ